MSEFPIPYHLVISIIMALFLLLFVIGNWKKLMARNTLLWLSAAVFLVTYLHIVGTAAYDATSSRIALNQFDLNGDGFFSGVELTSEQAVVMKKVTSDVGRNFSFAIAIIPAILNAVVFSLAYAIGRRIFKKKNES